MSAKPSAEGSRLPRPAETRERNGRIAAAARQHRFDPRISVPFICECSEERCAELLRLSLAEYRRMREACDYLAAPGHQIEGATIVRVKDGVWLYRES